MRKLPAALVALTSSCTPPSTPCVPEQVDAGTGVRTYHCKDGRDCGAPNPAAIDGGADNVYQTCPGANGCALVVAYDGTSRVDFC